MNDIELVIAERDADIGSFRVGRLLPFRQKRAIGPFVFIDHMGPAELSSAQNLDVLPHPHIGLSTLTYLLEGAIMHRDSIGSEVEIRPGAVNWMTAGKGVVHSERTPEYLRKTPKTLHGLQIWVALPTDLEESEPTFTHVEEREIPSWEQKGVQFKQIAGEIRGKKSPVPIHSKLYFLEIKSPSPHAMRFDRDFYGEWGVFILEGTITLGGAQYGPRQLLVAQPGTSWELEMAAHTTLYLFGGEPFPEKRLIDWNFVSSRRERLLQAREEWIAQRFPAIQGETEFVPYPGS
jgi:redox-sensitive bicupin YhaK (pirin superfamily)